MRMTETAPIACTLAPGALKDRLAWIAALTQDALRSHQRRGLVLELHYSPEAAGRVREMVRNEQDCCPFLDFDLREQPDKVRLIITAPEAAREAAETLFEHFVAEAPQAACACPTTSVPAIPVTSTPAKSAGSGRAPA